MEETPQSQRQQQKRWSHSSLLPFVVAMVVVGEIGFLNRVDLKDKAAAVEQWTSSYLAASGKGVASSSSSPTVENVGFEDEGDEERKDVKRCMEWLEREDTVPYNRDFGKDPILVAGMEKEWSNCAVGCKFGSPDQVPDAMFGLSVDPSVASVLRSMESSHYYEENNIDIARRRGYKIIMTTSLSSDIPVGYFSWTEYDIMAPPLTKTENALAAAFISNCGGHNFRLQALEMLEHLNIKIDSYGSCHRNRDGDVNKVETLKRYKFSLAFENSNEEDYVTEKFFQSLVAGAVPVVIGAPNIQDFAPSMGSVLHIKELADVSSVAKIMKHLAVDPGAYNQTVMWKYKGPSDSFKALVDMAAVHSSCRLCIHLATKIHELEEQNVKFRRRPCHCKSSAGNVYHLFVRERGRFRFESIYLSSDKLTLKILHSVVRERFMSLNHVPVWKNERPESIRGRGDDLKIYRIYPVGLTQRQALYTFQFKDDAELRSYVQSTPCAKLEVVFV